ncbi:arylsulfatase [Lacibacter sp.]|uniref:arylsulfatase n=1 Tax=Lacibacter sp. TaxID=1915409 RepID=UPI002B4B08A2|nr:arylsulfatase [Lacibacter sp.]HLP37697.1 arylsulfatase [Lacibacter sp.]
MKRIIVFLLIAVSVVKLNAQQRPNVIVILADDMGFSDLGCYGGEIPTPNLDALAKNGLRLTQFYQGARCCPTRASLLTGLYAHEAGIGFMTEALHNNPSYQGFINRNSVTLGETMQQAGYFTIMAGKWHVGHKEDQRPSARGFMRSLNAAAGGFYFSEDEKSKLFLNGKPVTAQDGLPQQWYSTDLWTNHSLKFIDEAKQQNKPFFLYLAENAPHFPLQAPENEIAKFKGTYMKGWEQLRNERYQRQLKMGLINKKYKLPPINPLIPKWDTLSQTEKNRYDHMMAIYAATVHHLDSSIGVLIKGLKEKGLYENTIIMFLSDNGGNAEPGIDGIYRGTNPGLVNSVVHIGQGWAEVNNTPFWLYKHHTSEGGIATPFIFSWPAGIQQKLKGTYNATVGHITDIMNTCLDAADANYPTVYNGNNILPTSGNSLLPLLSGNVITRTNPIFWEHEGNRAMRMGNYKITSQVNEPWRLYDMEKDRTELNDLAAVNPKILQQMIEQYETWYKRVNAQPYFKEPKRWQYSLPDAVQKTKTNQQ